MNNSAEQTKKTNAVGLVAGIATALALVIMFFWGIKDVVNVTGNLTELIREGHLNFNIIMTYVPSIIFSLCSMLSCALLAVYCVLNVVPNGKKVKLLYIAGFAILMIVSVCTVFSSVFNLISSLIQGWFPWQGVVSMIISVLSSAVTAFAYLFALIAGFAKKPKASRTMAVIASVLFLICAALALISSATILFYGVAFWDVVKVLFSGILIQLIRIIALVGTVLFLRPSNK